MVGSCKFADLDLRSNISITLVNGCELNTDIATFLALILTLYGYMVARAALKVLRDIDS